MNTLSGNRLQARVQAVRRNLLVATVGAPLLLTSRQARADRPRITMRAIGPKALEAYDVQFTRWTSRSASTGKVQVNLNVDRRDPRVSCACDWYSASFEVEIEDGFRLVKGTSTFDPLDCYTDKRPPIEPKPYRTVVHQHLKVQWIPQTVGTGTFTVAAASDRAGEYTGTAMIYFTVEFDRG